VNRIGRVIVASGVVLIAMGPVAALQLPVASLSPKTGLAGAEITVSVSQYSPNIVIEVHEDTVNGALIGTGTTDGSGTAAFPITVPASAPTGSLLMYICGLCASEYPEWATRGFQVTGPAPTTTTVAPTTTVATTPPTTTAPATTQATTTTAAITSPPTAAPGNGAATAPPSDSGEFSRGLLVGLIVALSVAFLVIVGLAIGSGKPKRGVQPPAPRPPPAPPVD